MNRLNRREFLRACGAAGAAWTAGCAGKPLGGFAPEKKPNILLFLADDLGSAQLGCYGETRIRTPRIDRLAAEGVRFTQAYSGSPVCAPSRCVLMTGLHSGHAFIRDNHEIQPEGQLPIPAETAALPKLLKAEGYATAAVGKWGLGYPGSEGEPGRQGIDLFFGYNCQRHAHNHYPTYLRRNDEKIVLEGNPGGPTGRVYAPDLCEAEAADFIRKRRDGPFFLFYATTIPHLALQVPEDSLAEYRGRWPETPYDGRNGYQPCPTPRAAYAAMVTRFDRSVGRILDLLEELGIAGDTLVLLASDNGATYNIGGYDMEFFKGNAPFRNHKGSIHEGGIRIPLIVRRPGRIRADRTCGDVVAFQDILPTLLEAAGAAGRVPAGIDGVSFRASLEDRDGRPARGPLYMEFPGYGGQQMVRLGNWKGVRTDLHKNPEAPLRLYDLEADIGETRDVAAAQPEVASRIRRIMRESRRPSREFPFPALDGES